MRPVLNHKRLWVCTHSGERPMELLSNPGCRNCSHRFPHEHTSGCDVAHPYFEESGCPDVCVEQAIEPMKVWIVWKSYYDEFQLLKAFETEDQAKEFIFGYVPTPDEIVDEMGYKYLCVE